jgi:hypothetical protein
MLATCMTLQYLVCDIGPHRVRDENDLWPLSSIANRCELHMLFQRERNQVLCMFDLVLK